MVNAKRLLPVLMFVVSSLGAVAHAGPVEQFVQLALHPTNPDVLALRYQAASDGLMFSRDGGKTFKLVCGAALGAMRSVNTLALTADGRAFAGTLDGLRRDDGRGCSWEVEPALGTRWVPALAVDPAHPDQLYAATVAEGDRAPRTQLWKRDAQAAWKPLSPETEEYYIVSLLAARIDAGTRIYELVAMYDLGPNASDSIPRYLTRFSDDGVNWTEYTASGYSSLRLEAVDPTNPDHLLFSNRVLDGPDAVWVSLDRGKTFDLYAQVDEFTGATFAPDGRVWFGSAQALSGGMDAHGLWFAEKLTSEPKRINGSYSVNCVGYQAATDKLFVCERFAFDVVDPKDGTPRSRFELVQVAGFADCGDTDLSAVCKPALVAGYCAVEHFPRAPLCAAYGVIDSLSGCDADPSGPACGVADAGSSDGRDNDPPSPPNPPAKPDADAGAPKHVESCDAAGGPQHGLRSLSALGCVLALLAFVLRRRASLRCE